MRFDLHVRSLVRDQIEQVAESMKAWEEQPRMTADESAHLLEALTFFPHTTRLASNRFAGVDGSGDFPALSYADSFVYVTVAQATVYAVDAVSGLREEGPVADPLVRVAWIPESEAARYAEIDRAFADLAGDAVRTVIEHSDYRQLKTVAARRSHAVDDLVENLIRPHAADAGNLGLQLRSTAELGALRRVLQSDDRPAYLLLDGTLSLPMVAQRNNSLFYEHLKRLCCVEARQRDVAVVALSKSHGLPAMELIEELAQTKAGVGREVTPEHWYLRLPVPGIDEWEVEMARGRTLPPIGAVTYLVRFHKNTPVMRIDLDVEYWRSHVHSGDSEATIANEQRLFTDLDYAAHDQRAFGYPYPLKAAHDRASLTDAERVALRKQIVDAAVAAGMKRSLFRDAAQATGHR